MKNRQTGYYWARTRGGDEEIIVWYSAISNLYRLSGNFGKFDESSFNYISNEKLEFKRQLQDNVYYLVKYKQNDNKDIVKWSQDHNLFYGIGGAYSVNDVIVISDPIDLETLK